MINWKKYKYNWNVEDNWWKSNKIQCSLCWTLIKYEYELQNIDDENDVIKVWCECVKNFDSEFFKTLTSSKRKFLNDKKVENVLNILAQLVILNDRFDYNKIIENFEDNSWFTPKQILVIYKDMIKYKIEFNFSDFKLDIRKKRKKEQILKLNNDEKIIISNFLTKQQRKRFNLL